MQNETKYVAIARWMLGMVVRWLSWWLRKLLDLERDGIQYETPKKWKNTMPYQPSIWKAKKPNNLGYYLGSSTQLGSNAI